MQTIVHNHFQWNKKFPTYNTIAALEVWSLRSSYWCLCFSRASLSLRMYSMDATTSCSRTRFLSSFRTLKCSSSSILQNQGWILNLKPHIHDKHLYGTGKSRALFRSEICLRANSPISPCQYVSKALISTWEKYGFSLVHTQRPAAIAQPIPMRQSKWQCGCVLYVRVIG